MNLEHAAQVAAIEVLVGSYLNGYGYLTYDSNDEVISFEVEKASERENVEDAIEYLRRTMAHEDARKRFFVATGIRDKWGKMNRDDRQFAILKPVLDALYDT